MKAEHVISVDAVSTKTSTAKRQNYALTATVVLIVLIVAAVVSLGIASVTLQPSADAPPSPPSPPPAPPSPPPLGPLNDFLLFQNAPGAPVVFELHGLGQSAELWSWFSPVLEEAAIRKWNVVLPDGYSYSWNAGNGTYGPAWQQQIDHVAELSNHIRNVREVLQPSHVFVTGASNGCAMAMRLGMEAEQGLVDGVACTSHWMNPSVTPSVPGATPLLLATGSNDPHYANESYVNRTLDTWAVKNGCQGARVPRDAPLEFSVATEFSSCDAPVRHALFPGVGHGLLFANYTGPMILDFFAEIMNTTA